MSLCKLDMWVLTSGLFHMHCSLQLLSLRDLHTLVTQLTVGHTHNGERTAAVRHWAQAWNMARSLTYLVTVKACACYWQWDIKQTRTNEQEKLVKQNDWLFWQRAVGEEDSLGWWPTQTLCSAEGLPACQPLNGCVCFTFQCTVPVMPTHHHQPLAGGLMCEQTSVESKYKILWAKVKCPSAQNGPIPHIQSH